MKKLYIIIDEEKCKTLYNFVPENDDLVRINCKEAGKPGHYQCGICEKHNQPYFKCGDLNKQ